MTETIKQLTAMQLEILKWIAEGCPEGVYINDGYGHRITARLLAGSGMVTITGRGESWTATITAKGRAILANAASTKATYPGPSQATDLYQQTLTAKGKLTIEKDVDKEHINQLIRSFNSSESRPRGKKLAVEYSTLRYGEPPNKATVYIKDYFEDFIERPSISIPDTVRKYHPVAKAFLADTNWHFMSEALVKRAARVLHALLTECEHQGWKIFYTPQSENLNSRVTGRSVSDGQVIIETENTTIQLLVREIPRTNAPEISYSDRYNLSHRKPMWMKGRAREFIPTGRLEIAEKRYGRSAGIRDGKVRLVEQQLPDLIVKIWVQDIETKKLYQERERQELIRKDRREKARRNAIEAFRKDKLLEMLNTETEKWERWTRANNYLDSLERQLETYQVDKRTELQDWIQQSRQVNQLQNPENNLPTYPEEFDPTAEELRPYLGGTHEWGYLDFY